MRGWRSKFGRVGGRELMKLVEAAGIFPDAEKIFVCRREMEQLGITVLTLEKLLDLE